MNKLDWNLNDIFATKEDIEKTKQKLEEVIKKIEQYKGKLADSSQNIYNCYKLNCKALELHEKLYAYAMLKYHQNMVDNDAIKLYKDIERITVDFSVRIAFIEPELTKIDTEVLKSYLNENENLKEFEKSLTSIIEEKKHILSEEQENLLAQYSEVLGKTEDIFNILKNTELDYPNIKDSNGNELKVTDGLYLKYMKSQDENIRKQAFESMHSAYKRHINSISEMYLTKVKTRTITSKIRNYKSSLEAAVKADDSSVKVYETLLKEVNKNLKINHEIVDLKAKLLNKEKVHMYDMHVNTLDKKSKDVSYEDAKKTVLEALQPMGKEYTEKLQEAFDNNWLDVMEKDNKRSGAYSMGVYGVHPYVLLNFVNEQRDISTIAHELGHSMHSYYANQAQNIINASYTIMVAEVASTVNETILENYLINNETDKNKKAILLTEHINNIVATLVSQTMFAEFEKMVHEKIENGEALSSDDLNKIYYDLVKKYNGNSAIFDEEIKYHWAGIHHFYRCFYVYKYATGITSAIVIASKILNNEPGYVEKYKEMLSLGGSKKSLDLLKMVDVDLEKEETYEIAFDYLKEKVEELKSLL